mgnify:CR=1 FL=1
MVPGGLILAGGRGERMGGQDKGFLTWNGEAFVAYIARCLEPVTASLAISANAHRQAYERWGDRVLPDRAYPQQGPLAGLYEGLEWAQSLSLPGVMVATCDTPALPAVWAVQMAETARANPGVPCISETPESRHPLHGYYPISVLPTLRECLISGENRAWRFAEQVGAKWLDCGAMADGFMNVNTAADQRELAGPGSVAGD